MNRSPEAHGTITSRGHLAIMRLEMQATFRTRDIREKTSGLKVRFLPTSDPSHMTRFLTPVAGKLGGVELFGMGNAHWELIAGQTDNVLHRQPTKSTQQKYTKPSRIGSIFRNEAGVPDAMNTKRSLCLTVICATIIGLVAYFAEVPVSFLPSRAPLYPAAGLETAFGAWFGAWGCLAAYFEFLIAGVSAGWFSLPLGFLLSLGDVAVSLAAALPVRAFHIDPSMLNASRTFLFVLVTLLGSFVGSLWFNMIQFHTGKLQSLAEVGVAVAGWNLSNLIGIPLFSLPLLRLLTRRIKGSGLFIRGWR